MTELKRRRRRTEIHLGLAARGHPVKEEAATRSERPRDRADGHGLGPGRRKIPSAILAMLPIKGGTTMEFSQANRLATIRDDLKYAAQRSQTSVAQLSLLKNQLNPQMGFTAIRIAVAGKPTCRPQRRAARGE